MEQTFTIKDFANKINLAEFQKTYLFKIELPTFYTEYSQGNIKIKGFVVPSDKIAYCTSSVSFPSSTTGIQTIPFYNSEIKIGTKTVYDPWTLTFKFNKFPYYLTDFFSCSFAGDNGKKYVGDSYMYFSYWRRCVHNIGTRISSIPDMDIKEGEATTRGYKHDIFLCLISDRLDYIDAYFVLSGAWPSSISGSSFDYSSDEISTFNVTLSFDDFYYETAG